MIATLTALIGAFFTIALVDTCLPRRPPLVERQCIDLSSNITSIKQYCAICGASNEFNWVSKLNCGHIYCPTCYDSRVRNKRGCHLCNFHIHSIKMIMYRADPNL